jgi:hypothetical protein
VCPLDSRCFGAISKCLRKVSPLRAHVSTWAPVATDSPPTLQGGSPCVSNGIPATPCVFPVLRSGSLMVSNGHPAMPGVHLVLPSDHPATPGVPPVLRRGSLMFSHGHPVAPGVPPVLRGGSPLLAPRMSHLLPTRFLSMYQLGRQPRVRFYVSRALQKMRVAIRVLFNSATFAHQARASISNIGFQ